ncbi:hypothetical protein ED733_001623 [Metarhizium rileyi]|uniref:Laccase 1 n=1 Tax=Metarhizium rileyi (strain RCEF 4871) TaxID=1649241 RepID=A0A5C6G213_METRR|nr:hypothetical protein ED733_001623 [Metarhizium rileyi]
MLPRLISGLVLAAGWSLPSALAAALWETAHLRKFDLTITWERRAPDGVARNMILINGQSPGPVIEVNEGDEVWVTVHNRLPYSTTIHYHGIEMLGTPWSDGVPGVTQRPIRPGSSFVYKWKASQYGEYWYHAHHKGQIDDGEYGPVIIHPKKDRLMPFGLITKNRETLRSMEAAIAQVRPLMLSEWRNIDANQVWDIQVAASMEVPCFDSLLVNGGFETNVSTIPTEIFDICTPTDNPVTVIDVHKSSGHGDGTWVAFDAVGAYSLLKTTFSIDGLSMWVYAVDGEYIEPQQVHAISMTNGDRYSFLVHVTDPGNYTIRHASTMPVQLISGQAILSYKTNDSSPANHTARPHINDAGVALGTDVVFYSQKKQKPYPASPVGQRADQTFILTLGNTEGLGYKWALNGTSEPMTLDDSDPVLFKPQPNLLNNLTITTLNNTWVDLIFVVTQVPQPAHPIHKHGNKMWLIGSGKGSFNYTTVEEAMKEMPHNFNLVDPPRRDAFATPDAPRDPTWMAVRYHVTDPGAWFLHCHIQAHLMGGMAMVIQDGVDHFPTVPPEYLSYGG